MSSALQPPGTSTKSRPLASGEEETETGIDLGALQREAADAVQTLVQLNTTPREESHPPPAFVIVSSQTGVVENAVSDNGIANATPRSSTPSNHILADLLPDLSAQTETQNTTSGIQASTSGDPNNGVSGVSDIPLDCLQLGDSLSLSDVLDDHRDTIRVGLAEQNADLVGCLI